MTRTVIDLSTTLWQFAQAARQPFSAHPRDDRAEVTEWLPARVPGDVRADLVAANAIPPLDTPEHIDTSMWVDEKDWWYRTKIVGLEPGTTVVLEADGIDYLSAVWLDGQLLATHQGMFARQSIPLPSLIEAPGKHELAIRVWGAGALPRLPNPPHRRVLRKLLRGLGLTEEYFPDRMATPKAQFSFGWDFAPRVLSTGVWDEIRLVYCRGAYLADVQVHADPLAAASDSTPVRWTVTLTVTRLQVQRLEADVALRSYDGELLSRETFDLGEAESPVLTFDSPALARWWPWDQGEPRLYRLSVRLFDERGLVDECEVVTGVRTIRRERFPGGQPWRFTVNGCPVFLRGANWVPAGILPGQVTPYDYTRLLGQARVAGINFMRIWGGGIREKRAFWESCNTLGIMAMQEFPLACAFLDHYPDDAGYLSVLQDEAQGIVRSLRNHPGLIAWCGGNEISPGREQAPLRTIVRVLEREDKTRPWIPASPSQGDIHNWDVWHGEAPWQSFARVTAPFMSEFGLQALPHRDTLAEMFGPEPARRLDDPAWTPRKSQANKLRHYAGPIPADDLVATIEATQRAQRAGLQVGIEACRLRREGSGDPYPCGGVAFWQFNEPWPVVSWSVIDGAGRPKTAYEMLRGSYQPLLVAARFRWRAWAPGDRFSAEVWVVNDAPEGFEGCTVEATLDGKPIHLGKNVAIQPASAHRIGSFRVRLEALPSVLRLVCRRDHLVLAQNEYDLQVYLPPPQPPGAWLMRRGADALLQID